MKVSDTEAKLVIGSFYAAVSTPVFAGVGLMYGGYKVAEYLGEDNPISTVCTIAPVMLTVGYTSLLGIGLLSLRDDY